jgi:hypothetical protein
VNTFIELIHDNKNLYVHTKIHIHVRKSKKQKLININRFKMYKYWELQNRKVCVCTVRKKDYGGIDCLKQV